MNISYLLRRHLAIKPIVSPAACPLVPHSVGKHRPPSIVSGIKGNAAKLCSEGSLATFKMNLLVLIMQFIVLSKHISSQTAPQEMIAQINLLI
jgi:hypothetical protein